MFECAILLFAGRELLLKMKYPEFRSMAPFELPGGAILQTVNVPTLLNANQLLLTSLMLENAAGFDPVFKTE
jgi:hypothetical protein